ALTWTRCHAHQFSACDYFPAYLVHDRLCPEICQFFRMDHGDRHSRFPVGSFYSYANDELALPEAGRRRKESTLPGLPALRGASVSADAELVPCAPARHHSDLRGYFSFHVWFLSPRRTRLDPRR